MKRAQYVSIILLLGLAALGAVYFLQQLDFDNLPYEDDANEEVNEIVLGDYAKEDDDHDYELEPGEHLIYKVKTLKSEGKEDWANDDVWEVSLYSWMVGDQSATRITSFEESLELGGSIVPEIYGNDLLVHRYATLLGEETAIEPTWGTIRSKNGAFQVDFSSIYDEGGVGDTFTLTNPARGQSETFTLSEIDPVLAERKAVPYHIANDASFIALSPTDLPMEGFVQYTTFLYHIDSGKVMDLSENKDLQKLIEDEGTATESMKAHWSYLPDQQKIWLSVFESVEDDEQVYTGWRSVAPFKLFEIDPFEKAEPRLLLQDDDFMLGNIRYSPDKKSLHYAINNDGVWIVPIGAERQNSHRVTSGRLIEWLEDGIVVDRGGNEIVYIDLNSKNITPLGRTVGAYGDEDYLNFEYIGSVSIE